MKFRLGLLIGFGLGYYLGSAAGRERHEQINRAVARLRRTDALELASDKAKAVVDLTVERARDIVDVRHPERHGGDGSVATYSSSR